MIKEILTFLLIIFIGAAGVLGIIDIWVHFQNRPLHFISKFGIFYLKLLAYCVAGGILGFLSEKIGFLTNSLWSAYQETKTTKDHVRYRSCLLAMAGITVLVYLIVGVVWSLQFFLLRSDPFAWLISRACCAYCLAGLFFPKLRDTAFPTIGVLIGLAGIDIALSYLVVE